MKKLIQFALASSLILSACNNSDETNKTDQDTHASNSAGSTTDKAENSNRMDAATDQATADFMMKAAIGGMMEVQLGEIAQRNAASQAVKDFGTRMVTDHSKANEELKALANARNVKLPAMVEGEHREEVNDIGKKSGVEFDKAYMNMMVDDHKKDVDEFENAANNLKDEGIKAFAAKTLPILKSHLEAAKNVQQQLKK
jgi:putative membrane protein